MGLLLLWPMSHADLQGVAQMGSISGKKETPNSHASSQTLMDPVRAYVY